MKRSFWHSQSQLINQVPSPKWNLIAMDLHTLFPDLVVLSVRPLIIHLHSVSLPGCVRPLIIHFHSVSWPSCVRPLFIYLQIVSEHLHFYLPFDPVVHSARPLFIYLQMLSYHLYSCLSLAHLLLTVHASIIFIGVLSFNVAKIFCLLLFFFISFITFINSKFL